jgi:hypothetical protein
MRRTRLGRGDWEASELPSAGELIEAILREHRKGVILVRSLLLAQETADGSIYEAEQSDARAASHPRDRKAGRVATEAAARSAFANDEELRATERWARHLGQMSGLLAAATKLYPAGRLGSPGPRRPAAAAPPGRARGHCA